MRVGSLSRLVDTARSLPGERKPVPGPVIPPRVDAAAATDGAEVDAEEIARLRRRVGALLAELSRRLEPALTDALVRAATAWDQFDAFAVLDDALVGEGAAIREVAARLARLHDDRLRAAGVETLLVLDAALGLVSLVERRLATLVRLRVRGTDPALLPAGRPFLDVAAALAEAARAWA